jgi:histidinol-phosphate/aromatic aminotransferase/cobyric acid decarboxylase-like protein
METALRITVGTPEENRRLIKTMRKCLEEARSA